MVEGNRTDAVTGDEGFAKGTGQPRLRFQDAGNAVDQAVGNGFQTTSEMQGVDDLPVECGDGLRLAVGDVERHGAGHIGFGSQHQRVNDIADIGNVH